MLPNPDEQTNPSEQPNNEQAKQSVPVEFSNECSGVACARCEGTLEVVYVGDFKIAGCQSCGGMLIENRLLASIINTYRAEFEGPDAVIEPLNQAELRVKVDCVVCLNRMDTHAYCGPGSVVVDSCIGCGLVWLDGNELQRIVEAPGPRELNHNQLFEFDPKDPLKGVVHRQPTTLFDSFVANHSSSG